MDPAGSAVSLAGKSADFSLTTKYSELAIATVFPSTFYCATLRLPVSGIPSYFVISGRAPMNNATENLFPTFGSVFQSQIGSTPKTNFMGATFGAR